MAKALGPRRYESELAQRTSVPGVATGLAWTPTGGEIMFIEATAYPGKGGLMLTGQIGDVMKESAQAAFSLLKSRAAQLHLARDLLAMTDIHVHVPAGAVPKDGPSAGVAMFTALTSLLTDRVVRPDLAMTGEITLRGLVLPIAGLKEKVLAAKRAGIRDGRAARAQPQGPGRRARRRPQGPEVPLHLARGRGAQGRFGESASTGPESSEQPVGKKALNIGRQTVSV